MTRGTISVEIKLETPLLHNLHIFSLSTSSIALLSYCVCLGRDKVRIVDGTLSRISDMGRIIMFPLMPLSTVLHVTLLLIFSVSNITKSLNYSILFFPSHCL